jgi:hypothetical protein
MCGGSASEECTTCEDDGLVTCWDGSCAGSETDCPEGGCTDTTACNYDPAAEVDDGSCEFESCCETNSITLVVDGGSWQSEVTWDFAGESGGAPSTTYLCLEDGDYDISGCDSYGDGWNGNTANFYEDGGLIATWDGPSFDLGAGECETVTISIGVEVIAGCTDDSACNYDPAATLNDGSCWYPQEGCSCESGDSDGDGLCDEIDNCDGGVVDECGVCAGDGTACADCASPNWYDDNYCDTSNNTAECGYDGGDCCPGDCPVGGYNNPGSYSCEVYGGTCPDCIDPNSADNAEGGQCEDYEIMCSDTDCWNYYLSNTYYDYTCSEIEDFGYDCSYCDAEGLCPEECEDIDEVTCWDGSCAVTEEACPEFYCDTGYVDDCSGDGDCCPEGWIGDSFADCTDQAYGCDLTCYECDGGDCEESDLGCSTCEDDGLVTCWDGSCADSEADCPVGGCMDAEACNYNEESEQDDGSCLYYDCLGECGGDVVEDCAGECGGSAVICWDGFCADSEADCPEQPCDNGFVADCSGDGDCCPESWIADGFEDCEDQQYGCDLTCYDNDGRANWFLNVVTIIVVMVYAIVVKLKEIVLKTVLLVKPAQTVNLISQITAVSAVIVHGIHSELIVPLWKLTIAGIVQVVTAQVMVNVKTNWVM